MKTLLKKNEHENRRIAQEHSENPVVVSAKENKPNSVLESENKKFQAESAAHVKKQYGFDASQILPIKPDITIVSLYPESPSSEEEQKAFEVGKAIEKSLEDYAEELVGLVDFTQIQGTEGAFQQLTEAFRNAGNKTFSGPDAKGLPRFARFCEFNSALTYGSSTTYFRDKEGKTETNLLESSLPPTTQDVFGIKTTTIPKESVLPKANHDYVTHLPDLKFRIELAFPAQDRYMKFFVQLDEATIL
jgi:hypothetical protein